MSEKITYDSMCELRALGAALAAGDGRGNVSLEVSRPKREGHGWHG